METMAAANVAARAAASAGPVVNTPVHTKDAEMQRLAPTPLGRGTDAALGLTNHAMWGEIAQGCVQGFILVALIILLLWLVSVIRTPRSA